MDYRSGRRLHRDAMEDRPESVHDYPLTAQAWVVLPETDREGIPAGPCSGATIA